MTIPGVTFLWQSMQVCAKTEETKATLITKTKMIKHIVLPIAPSSYPDSFRYSMI
jgi:hypothetical protein